MTARQFWINLGSGVVGSGVAAFFTTWWPVIGAACFLVAWLVGRKRKTDATSPFAGALRELVVRASDGRITLSGDEGELEARFGFVNEFPDAAVLTLATGSLQGVGTGGPITLSAVPDEFDLPPRGARLTADAEVWKRLRFTLNASQVERVRAAAGLTRGATATRSGTWSLFPAGNLRRSSSVGPWERGASINFIVEEIPT